MINKKNNKRTNNIEKYILILLISGYLLGFCVGCYFVFGNTNQAEFTNRIVKISNIKTLIYFILPIVFKYSGALSTAMCGLPFFMGVQNSAYYCNLLRINKTQYVYTTIISMLKDSAIVFLLILYLIVTIIQIIHKRYKLKKDLKYFGFYFSGALIILSAEYIITKFIF